MAQNKIERRQIRGLYYILLLQFPMITNLFYEEGTKKFYYKMKENLITRNAHFRAIFGILQIVVSRDKF